MTTLQKYKYLMIFGYIRMKLLRTINTLLEKAPPDEKLNAWIEDPKTKAEYKKRYGDNWEGRLYSIAWMIYNRKVEKYSKKHKKED